MVTMKRISFLAIAALPLVAVAQNHWTATCIDDGGRMSPTSVSVSSPVGCTSTVTADAPAHRLDGSVLPLSSLASCQLYRTRAGGIEAYRLTPAAQMTYVYQDGPACVTAPITAPANLTYVAGRFTFTPVPGAPRHRLHAANCATGKKSSGSLGQSGGSSIAYTAKTGSCYIVRAVLPSGKESANSNVVRVP